MENGACSKWSGAVLALVRLADKFDDGARQLLRPSVDECLKPAMLVIGTFHVLVFAEV